MGVEITWGTPAPSATTLCTLEDARAYIGASATDDAVLQRVLDAASAAILRHPKMPRITIGVVSQERTFYASYEKTLFVPECLSVAAVTDADDVAIEYTAIPGMVAGEFVRWLELAVRTSGQVKVTGTWGYASVPADLEQAALVTTKVWYERDRAAFLVGVDLNTGFVERPQALPRQVLGLLDGFRQQHLGLP